MKVTDLYEAARTRRRYDGPPLESGETSTNFPGMGTGMKSLINTLPENGTILDYGAGKFARISNLLRDQGFRVYAFDPFNGDSASDGWTEGASSRLPRNKFDVGFTSFVLNVVPEYIEKTIIEDLAKRTRVGYHITRNKDVITMVTNGLKRGDKTLTAFFMDQYATRKERRALETDTLTDAQILDFCQHGTATSKGFQRIPTAEDYGIDLIRNTGSFKIYQT